MWLTMRKLCLYIQYACVALIFILLILWALHLDYKARHIGPTLLTSYYEVFATLGVTDYVFGLIGPWLILWSLWTTIFAFRTRSK